MKYSLKQASDVTGKSKPTIQRAIKKGLISANKNDRGFYMIDPSELHRIYPSIHRDETVLRSIEMDLKQGETVSETVMLRDKISVLDKSLNDKDTIIDDLRKRLDRESEERRKLTMMLVDQRRNDGLFSRLFGRK